MRGKGTHSKASNFSPSCMLNVSECQRGRQREVSCEGVSFILRSLLDNADSDSFVLGNLLA